MVFYLFVLPFPYFFPPEGGNKRRKKKAFWGESPWCSPRKGEGKEKSRGRGKVQEREHPLLLFRPLVEPLRSDRQRDNRDVQGWRPPPPSCLKSFIRNPSTAVIPEIFSRESRFLLFLWFLDTSGPRLKDCRGDERRMIEAFRGRLKTARKWESRCFCP